MQRDIVTLLTDSSHLTHDMHGQLRVSVLYEDADEIVREIRRLRAENERLKIQLKIPCEHDLRLIAWSVVRPVCAYCGRHPPYCDCDTYPFPADRPVSAAELRQIMLESDP